MLISCKNMHTQMCSTVQLNLGESRDCGQLEQSRKEKEQSHLHGSRAEASGRETSQGG